MRRRTLGLLLLVGAGACTGAGLLLDKGPHRGALVVRVEGIEPERGDGPLRVALYGAPEGFPRDPAAAARTDTVAVGGTEALHVFADVPEGVWAVSVLHDADADGEMDADWLGRPKEGWGVTNDATGTFGPPSFEDAAVQARGDTTAVRIRLRY